MTKRQWHSGPPPSVGWWPASIDENPKTIRWWDGMWSVAVDKNLTAEMAASFALVPSLLQDKIQWTKRWWE